MGASMGLATFINFFIHPSYFQQFTKLKKAELFVKACFLTAIFSTNYVVLSIVFSYDKGIYLMIYNIIGFIALPFFVRTRIPITWLGNIYVFIGASAVVILTYYSGGVWSAIYPWIISIPVLALLVVNRFSGAFWGFIALLIMVWFSYLALQGWEFPKEYNQELQIEWYITILPGLLLIILFISFVFEISLTRALKELSVKNEILENQKETIARQAGKLEELIEEKDYIIRILAHDLRSPLRNINSLVGFTKTDDNPDNLSEYLEKISHSSSSAIDLVNKVLEMDTIEQDSPSTIGEETNLLDILIKAVKEARKTASQKDINISQQEAEEQIFVKADTMYLGLVFENLLSNAIKFSPEKSNIVVNWAKVNSSIQIKFRDEGPGIHPEEKEQLFKKFSRLSARPTGGESTTGLGLALVRKYVSMMAGKVWHEYPRGKGSVFVVELPLLT